MADRLAVGLHQAGGQPRRVRHRHEDYDLEQGELALAGKLSAEELAHLRGELAAMEAKGPLPLDLRVLVEALDRLPAASAGVPPRTSPVAPALQERTA